MLFMPWRFIYPKIGEYEKYLLDNTEYCYIGSCAVGIKSNGKLQMKLRIFTTFLMAAFCVSGLTGCLTATYVQHSPQTYFSFPNSNVIPLGPVKADAAGPSGVFKAVDLATAENDDIIYRAALAQQPDAKLIINYTKIYSGYLFWPVTWSKLHIEGTACNMVVGQQDVNK